MTRRALAAVLLGLVAVVLLPAPAQAHPLGNFTTNQYAGLRVTTAGIDIDYVLDLAELPAYQTRNDEIDTNHDATLSAAESDSYAQRTCTAAATSSTLVADGRRQTLTARPAGLTFPPGAGGLTTLRLQCVLHATTSITTATPITYESAAYPDRIGWREITAVGDRFTLIASTVPVTSTSARLTAYPPGAVNADTRTASFTARPGGPAAAPAPFGPAGTGTSQARDVDRFTAWFTDLVGHPRLTLGVGVLAVLIALILGGAHAVAPGHGKTIMAAYLVGSRGRLRQALTVAASVAVTHTLGVLALGIILATSVQLAPDSLYDWLKLTSGILVALVGGQLLHQAIRRLRTPAHTHLPEPSTLPHHHAASSPAHIPSLVSITAPSSAVTTAIHPGVQIVMPAHTHDHDHGHAHTHDHGDGRPHTHYVPAPDEPVRVRTLLAMGFAGGLSPSPSAVVVLLGAAALGRAWYGVILVLAYGIGLAATLTGIGFALARWGDRLHRATAGRWPTLLTRRMPTATATIILLVGLGMAGLAALSLLNA
ncbi:hypothetical protein GCM10010435_69230 [Winogradskya consettensis]|uniref:High-affinity nickel-transporter n=1 Tax=Winogradskya consettensis TaxID=113560 RepID=A0A919SKQ0_9ACTN|nr:sulfite exporter TauE/SafE family protein [Actinoplanes consettensis]GIM73499.1 hypothetical protein Aco04nite_35550 [Actinoplanes consettensis]